MLFGFASLKTLQRLCVTRPAIVNKIPTSTSTSIRHFTAKRKPLDGTSDSNKVNYSTAFDEDFKGFEGSENDCTDGDNKKKTIKRIMPDGKALEMLRIYKEIHNNLHIFPSYEIPAEDPWPPEFHGYQLGKKVTSIRRQRRFLWDYYIYRLDKLDFIWSPKDYRFDKVARTMEIYKDLYGHLQVPQLYTVPKDDVRWPRVLWGYNFGKVVHHIRCAGVYADKREFFEKMGISYTVRPIREPDFDAIKAALQVYYKKYGKFEVPYHYVIPKDDHDFPANMRGAQLGVAMCQIVHRNYYEQHHHELEAMGVKLEPRFEIRFQRIYEAIKCFQSIHGRKHIPQRFQIPHGSKDYPEHLWGMKLGRTVASIRLRGDFKEFHHLLRELGIPTKDEALAASQLPSYSSTRNSDPAIERASTFTVESKDTSLTAPVKKSK